MYEVTSPAGNGFCFGRLESPRSSQVVIRAYTMPKPAVIKALRVLNALVIFASAALFFTGFPVSPRFLFILLWAQIAQFLFKLLVLWRPFRLEINSTTVIGQLNHSFVYEQMLFFASLGIICVWCGIRGLIPMTVFAPMIFANSCFVLWLSRMHSR